MKHLDGFSRSLSKIMNNKSEQLEFNLKGYSQSNIRKVLDKTFSEFGQPQESLTDGYSVDKAIDKFFADYRDLYYLIPVTGSTNSHQYLLENSSEICTPLGLSQEIQPLLDEINLLRSQSIQDKQTIFNLQLQLNSGSSREAD